MQEACVDLKKLSRGDQIIGASGILLLIFSFLPWFKIEIDLGPFGDSSASANGWDYFLTGIIPVLLGLIMVAHVALTNFSPQTKLPTLPVTWGQIHMGAGGLAALLVILRLLIGEDDPVDRSYGLFLATLAAIGLAVGGYFKMKEPDRSATPPTSF
jgi:hypothetical protein